MEGSHKANWSPGKTHVIRLNQKDLTVHVSYSSPEPKDKTQSSKLTPPRPKYHLPLNSKRPLQQHNINSHLKNKVRKKEQPLDKKRQKEFYVNCFDECHTLIPSYEQFHLNLAERKTKKRLKVYSNSKSLSQENSIPNYQRVPVKTINLKSAQQHPTALFKKSNKIASNKQDLQASVRLEKNTYGKQATIRLYERNKQIAGNRSSPLKHRSHKLSVISSSSRKKHDSLISREIQPSTELFRIRDRFAQPGESIIVNSFNTSLNH